MSPTTQVEALVTAFKENATQLLSVLENVPVNVMCADRDLTIQYANPASKKTLASLEQQLPIKVRDLIGTNIDVFHQDPSMQRRLLADPSNLPYQAVIQVGEEKLDLRVMAMISESGEYLGPMATWEVVTEKLAKDEAIAKNAESLSNSAETLTAVSQQMSANADQTTAQAQLVDTISRGVSENIDTVASGTEEMSATIKEIAKNATKAAQVASEGVSVAQDTSAIIAKLGESSQEIGQVIKVITSIAQQTNLLALNATIEAARAGDAGKGFAVVANEVKELAKETAKATEDISRKVEMIQTDSKDSVSAIEKVSDVIGQINDIQGTIASAVEEQSATTNEMARNVADANKGSDEIVNNIGAVSKGAMDTSRGATDLQASAVDLSKMASDLMALLYSTAS